ncbi:MAG: hypothetical protein ABEJ48_05860 [Halobacteriales archaeon]
MPQRALIVGGDPIDANTAITLDTLGRNAAVIDHYWIDYALLDGFPRGIVSNDTSRPALELDTTDPVRPPLCG